MSLCDAILHSRVKVAPTVEVVEVTSKKVEILEIMLAL